MIGCLALVGNFAHAHGGGHYASHTYSHVPTVHKHVVKQVYITPKKHYHPATAYVPAEYHAHTWNFPFHKHYYWKQTHYAHKAHHH